MPKCPEVDSVYYLRKDIFTDIPGEVAKGIQFYVDLDGGDINSHYFRWELIETWELPCNISKRVVLRWQRTSYIPPRLFENGMLVHKTG